MENVDSHVKTLEKLGLTSLQARIYLTAVTLQSASVRRIAEKSEVARTDVYRIVPTLEKLGLLKKIISTPTMYEATALKDGCSLLLQRKKEEYTEAKLKAKELIEEFQKKPPQTGKPHRDRRLLDNKLKRTPHGEILRCRRSHNKKP